MTGPSPASSPSLRPGTPNQASPLDADDLRRRVQSTLDTFLAARMPLLAEASPQAAPLGQYLVDLLSGGKRLRPAFAWWGWRAAGGCPDGAAGDAAMTAAASLELLQACALVHDDLMDGSDTRRGLPSVHRRFAALHRGEGWLGSPESFGMAGAILAGDLALSWADELLLTCELPARELLSAKRLYDLMRTELMAGQYLDVLEQASGGGGTTGAMRVVRYKAAKYTVERPLQIGAALAGGSVELLAALSRYGLPLGEAFQLRDDVLGVFGDPSQTGKPAGDDLREGKRTVIVALTLERATDAGAAFLRRHLGDPSLEVESVDALRGVILDTGALSAVEQMISALTEQALAALRDAELDPIVTGVLADLALASTSRSF